LTLFVEGRLPLLLVSFTPLVDNSSSNNIGAQRKLWYTHPHEK
jgi:hypothetical protein